MPASLATTGLSSGAYSLTTVWSFNYDYTTPSMMAKRS
jgi:hypothetical protein